MSNSQQLLENFDPSVCIAAKTMQTQRMVNTFFRKHLQKFELSNSQVSILFMLSKKQVVKQHELANMLYLEKSSMSRNLKRLFDKQLIQRMDNHNIVMTEKGLEYVSKIIPYWKMAMEAISIKLGNEGIASLNLVFNLLKV